MRPPKIGHLTIKSPYRDIEEEVRRTVLKALVDCGLEVVVDDVILNRSEAESLVKKLRQKEVDLLITNFHGWQPGEVMIHLAKLLPEIPLVIWVIGKTQIPQVTGALSMELSGLLEATSNLKRIGREFKIVIGEPDGGVLQRIQATAKAAALCKELHKMKVGIIGCPPPGMLDATPYELGCIARFGLHVEHVDLLEIATEKEQLSKEVIQRTVEAWKKNFNIKTQEEAVIEIAELYLALKKVIDTHNLTAVTLRCSPELRYSCLPCLALSVLSEEGITNACEADLSSAVTALILKDLANTCPCTFDFGNMDKASNTIELWHCGFCWNTELAETSEKLSLAESPFGKGVFLSLCLKPGQVTLAKLDKECNKMLITEGEVIKPKEKREGGFAEVRLKDDVNEFLLKAAINGFEHHIVLVYGKIKDELLELCNILGINAIL